MQKMLSKCLKTFEPAHASKLLKKVVDMGSTLKKLVVDSRAKSCWVLDTCCMTSNPKAGTSPGKLRFLFAGDGAHFTKTG
jgi:hypothetical protein